ncbi:MAG: hypothetical protein KBG02_02575 [Haliscomenobacter sp.]|nr:hypothetical protein [Haliscomenobacter sp.]MBP9075718.1 hypothetical protein [Haliscomenobacter sp.]MBP9873868.1 hypothetical protein [Haliscomenobacter sp.]
MKKIPVFQFDPGSSFSPAEFYAPQTEESARDLAPLIQNRDAAAADLADQFVVFQLAPDLESPTLLETSMIQPRLAGSAEQPDVKMTIDLLSFHLSEDEDVDRNMKATMRIVIGKDENSSDRFFDTAYWVISAGMDLYNDAKNRRAEPREFQRNLNEAFGNRAIEIPGGLAKLTFDVIRNKQDTWWDKIFGALKSPLGQTLTTAIGFPAVGLSALNMVDSLLDEVRKEKNILFNSRPMTLALTQYARDQYTAGNARIRVGCLSPGFCLIARGRDFKAFNQANAYFYPAYGKLIPADVAPEAFLSPSYQDPFAKMTYAIFRIGVKEESLNF